MRLVCCVGLGIGIVLALVLCWRGLSSTSPSSPPAEAVAPPPPWFSDVTEEVGLNFVHDAGPSGTYFMPAIVGSGAALFDFDNDGRLDLYLVQNGGPQSQSTNRLFRQGPDGKFVDVSKGSGLDIAGYGMGVAVGDVNNDGWPDVLVTEYGRIRLFLNNHNGTFTDITKEAGLDNPLWATSASFFDYDRDGWLDLVVVNYLSYDPKDICDDRGGKRDFCGPSTFTGTVTKLYHHLGCRPVAQGNVPRFEDVSVQSGLGRVKGPGLGVVCADFNGDHWPDILIANDGAPNHLWMNQKDGTFKEEAVLRGLAYDAMGRPQANMGIGVGDVDGDGLLDVFMTHLPSELHVCWKQGPLGHFQDSTGVMGLAGPKWRSTGFGTLFGDFDQDGSLDLALANGAVKRYAALPGHGDPASFWDWYAERNQLFANDGTGKFRDISLENVPFCGAWSVSRGLACGDIDGDGALDLLVTRIGASARLYRNVAPGRGHWLMVRAVDPALGGRDAYGAEITVHAGDRRWKRPLNPGYSYLCSNDPRAHFGLGRAERVEAIDVLWPDGTEEHFAGSPADRVVVIRKGEKTLK
jgi:hypothetical protein